jgi:hypothetical protein
MFQAGSQDRLVCMERWKVQWRRLVGVLFSLRTLTCVSVWPSSTTYLHDACGSDQMRYCVAERSHSAAGARCPDSAIHASPSPLLILIEL